MYSIEITNRTWYGVTIPEWLRVFDCRGDDIPRSPWGTSLFSGERAAVDMGLRTEKEKYDGHPSSCSTYIDSRTAPESELVRQVTDMVKEAERILLEFRDAQERPAKPGAGGSCFYLPVAICLANYGWSVMVDERVKAIRTFDR